MRLLLLALSVILAATDTHAVESARYHAVKCAATINVWVEVDGESLSKQETTNIENKKRVLFSLIDSAAYRGDAVLCNYATRRRDVVTSYSIRCPQPRKERGYRHSYLCS